MFIYVYRLLNVHTNLNIAGLFIHIYLSFLYTIQYVIQISINMFFLAKFPNSHHPQTACFCNVSRCLPPLVYLIEALRPLLEMCFTRGRWSRTRSFGRLCRKTGLGLGKDHCAVVRSWAATSWEGRAKWAVTQLTLGLHRSESRWRNSQKVDYRYGVMINQYIGVAPSTFQVVYMKLKLTASC